MKHEEQVEAKDTFKADSSRVPAFDQTRNRRAPTAPVWVTYGLLLICLGLYSFQAYTIHKYAVNIPFWDEWAMFSGDDHPARIDRAWLQKQHNEHRIATTKIFVWLQFRLNGWNYPINLLLNFGVFGLFLAYLVRFARKVSPALPLWFIFGFTIFLLSPINWFNHFSAIQIAFHLQMLFLFICCSCLFDARQRTSRHLIACFAAVLGIYSAAGGVITAFVLLVAFSAFKGWRLYHAGNRKERLREFLQLILVLGIIGAALGMWLAGYTKPLHHPPLVYPASLRFWGFFVNLVSLGFGFLRLSYVLGALCLAILLVPIAGELWQRKNNFSSVNWAGYIVVLAILVQLASIAMGRAGFGVGPSKSFRYVELATPLALLSACHWASFLKGRKSLQKVALVALWIFCLASFTRTWKFGVYKTASEERLEGRRCVEAYYQGSGNDRCPTISPFPLGPVLEQAKRLNASFYNEFELRQAASNQHNRAQLRREMEEDEKP